MALKNDDIVPVRQRKYLAKDFTGLRAQILEYTRQYYPDRLQDFSEASLGGLFLDMAAYVGDNMSFYLDHQYGELNPETAVEPINIQNHLKNAGVQIVGTSPAVVEIEIYFEIPAISSSGKWVPDPDLIPVVQQGSVFSSNNGTSFILTENIDFSQKNPNNDFLATITDGEKLSDGTVLTKIMSRKGFCVSGKETTETIPLGNFVPFRRITLLNANVTEIISVIDGFGNTYYKVDALTNDVVYKNVLNTSSDNDIVKDSIKIIPAPFRFITDVDLSSRKTTIILGGGSADSFEDDVIPDPSDFAIPFVYQKTFNKVSINPKNLLQTKTQGISSQNTPLTIRYRYGGSLSDNVPTNSITTVTTLKCVFPTQPNDEDATFVRSSIEITNPKQASGGEDAPTIDELKSLIPIMKGSQERIVSKEDLIARIYSLPSNFGRVFRAAIGQNQSNTLSSQLFVVSRNSKNQLTLTSDTLKENIVKFLSPYRLISDAIDILDAKIINISFNFEITIDPTLNKDVLGQQVISKLKRFFNIKNFHINQPINKSDLINLIFSIPGVMSVDSIKIEIPVSNGNLVYSSNSFNVENNTVRNSLIVPPDGGIFELKYPDSDIKGIVR
jgi:hypothetical protein